MLRPISTLASLSRLWLSLLLMPLLWALPSTAVQAAQFEAGEQYELPSGQTISEDLFWAGNALVIAGTVNGDLFAAGQTIHIDGVVTGHVFAAGAFILLTGEVGGDLYAAGETVIVEGTVAKDLRVAAGGGDEMPGNLTGMLQPDVTPDPEIAQRMAGSERGVVVSPGAEIGGDTLAAGSDISLAGQFGSDVRAAGTNIVLADSASLSGDLHGEAGSEFVVRGRIAGDADLKSPQFEFGDGLSVGGDLAYGAPAADPQAPAAARFHEWDPQADQHAESSGGNWGTWIFRTLSVLAGTALLVFLSNRIGRSFFEGAATEIRTQAGMAVVWGVVSLLAMPFMLGLLPFLGFVFFGVPVAIMIWAFLMLIWFVFWVFSPLITGRTLGGLLEGALPGEQIAWPKILAGVVIVVLAARLVFLPSGAGLPDLVRGILGAVGAVVIVLSYILAVGGWVQTWGRGGRQAA
ncbi:MAG: hypothetical protein OXC13_10370 [Caldilineaceae bacterium]|nr:hypothetical protein [Caldilineaceae bacterium]